MCSTKDWRSSLVSTSSPSARSSPSTVAASLRPVMRNGCQPGSRPCAAAACSMAIPSISTSTPAPFTAKTPSSRNTTSPRGVGVRRESLLFLAQDAKTRVFCYANTELRKNQQNDEVLRFIDFWKQHTGQRPDELIFDSKLTTYANLKRVNQQGIDFITLRRRTPQLVHKIAQQPFSAWRRIELEATRRAYRTPRILDQTIRLRDYDR